MKFVHITEKAKKKKQILLYLLHQKGITFSEAFETTVTVMNMIVIFARIYKTGQNFKWKNFVIKITCPPLAHCTIQM